MAISNSDQMKFWVSRLLQGWGITLTVRVLAKIKKAGHSWG
jgi:hypothetical protein